MTEDETGSDSSEDEDDCSMNEDEDISNTSEDEDDFAMQAV